MKNQERYNKGNAVEFEDGSEWIIYNSVEDAESDCVEYVAEQIENEPEMFNQDWLKNYITFSDTDRKMIAEDLVGDYPSDIRDEEDGKRLAEEANLLDEYLEIQEKIDDADVTDENIDIRALKNKKEELLDKAEEIVKDEMFDKYYKDLEDPYECLVVEQGIYSAEDFLKQYGYSINIDEAAQDAVNVDGIAHFFASYDGNEVYLDDGTVMYREN